MWLVALVELRLSISKSWIVPVGQMNDRRFVSGCDDTEHFVTANLKLVGDGFDRGMMTAIAESLQHRCEVRRGCVREVFQQREDPHFGGDAQQFEDGGDVKVRIKLRGVGEQKMGAEGEVELAIGVVQIGQGIGTVTSCAHAVGKIIKKLRHRRPSLFAQSFRRFDVIPHKFFARAVERFDDDGVGFVDALLDLLAAEVVDGIAGNDAATACREFGVKARWPRGTIENFTLEIVVAEGEHVAIVGQRSPPGDDAIELKCHLYD